MDHVGPWIGAVRGFLGIPVAESLAHISDLERHPFCDFSNTGYARN